MAISIVTGSPVAGAKTNGAAALTFNLPTMQEGDLVVAWGGHFWRTGVAVAPTDAGYTERAIANSANPGCGVWTKFMGATPDTSITFAASGNNADAIAGAVYVLRGVNQTTPIDATVGSAAGADPASVTVATTGAAVLVLGFGAPSAADTTPGTITSYTVPTIAGTTSEADTNDAHVIAAHLLNASSGAQNPAAWSTLTASGYHQFTVAIRPAPPSGTGSGTWTFTGAATGKAGPGNGTATGTLNFAGTAVGYRLSVGSATGTYNFAGAAVGEAPGSAPPVIRGTNSNASNGTAGASISTTLPTGIESGDVGYLVTNQSTGTDTCSTPSGWTLIDGPETNGAVNRAYLFRRVMDGTEDGDTVTATWSSGGRSTIGVIVVGNVASTYDMFYTQDSTGDTSFEVSAFTPTENDALGVIMAGAYHGSVSGATLTPPSGWTEHQDRTTINFASGAEMHVMVLSRQISGGGSQAAVNGSYPLNGNEHLWVLALHPVGEVLGEGTASGTFNFTGAATGARSPVATTTGTFNFAGSATGAAGPGYGTAAGTWNFAGSASGIAPARGNATGTFAFTGAAVGEREPKASTTGQFAFTGAAVGERDPKASTTGTFTFTGAAAGERDPKAVATGTWLFQGAASGDAAPNVGVGIPGAWSFTGSAAGINDKEGAASGTFTFTGAAAGKRTPKASTTGSYSFTGAATGKRTPVATTTGTFSFTSAAAGSTTKRGTATGTYSFTGAATGKRPPIATAVGSWAFTGAAAGESPRRGSASGTFHFTGGAVGSAPTLGMNEGSALGTWTFTGSAAGLVVRRGSASGAYAYSGSAVGLTERLGSATGQFAFTGAAAGNAQRRGTATGTWLFTGAAIAATSGKQRRVRLNGVMVNVQRHFYMEA
jgi:hypothetical protein